MGSSYSVLDVVDPRVDHRIHSSEHRERLQETFRSWTLDDVRHVVKELKSQNPDADLRQAERVRWTTLFSVLEESEYEISSRIAKEAREKFHPACHSYAMIKVQDSDSSQLLSDIQSTHSDVSEQDEGVEGEETDIEDEQAATFVEEDKSEVEEESDDEKERQSSYSAETCSPIFFGYCETSAKDEDLERKSTFLSTREKGQVEDQEESILKARERKARDKFERRMAKLKRERLELEKKVESERNQIRQAAKREQAAARKAMADSEYNHFIRDAEKTERDNEVKWKEEDLKRKANQHREINEENRLLREELGEIAEKLARFYREKHAPKGEKLVEQNLTLVTELKATVSKLRSEASLRYMEWQEAIKKAGKNADKNPHRSMILVAEGEYKKAQGELESELKNLEAQEEELEKARDLEAREARFVSLFYALVDLNEELGSLAYSMEIFKVALLLTISCNVVLEKKLRFVFELFATNGRDYLLEPEVLAIIETTVRVLENVGGCLKSHVQHEDASQSRRKGKQGTDLFRSRKIKRCPSEFLASLTKRQFDLCKISEKQGGEKRLMTEYEFYASMQRIISVSQDLSQVFGVPWKYANMSRWQLTRMSYIQKYELGILSLAELNKRIARLWVTMRPALSHERKLEIHERALAMGANDPLKPTYAKFMKKKKHRLQSDVEPLEHGSLGNVLYYQEKLVYDSAMLVQAAWRAKVGRRLAEQETKRRAFFAAWDAALAEARDQVQAEFQKREEQPAGGVARMKWDAKVRMKQVKLRAKGKNLTREEVVQLLAEEEIRVAHETVTEHFTSMKEERGFKSDEEITNQRQLEEEKKKELEFKSIVSSEIINVKKKTDKELLREARLKQRRLKRDAEREFVKRLALEKKGWNADDPATYELVELTEELKREDFVDLDNLDYVGNQSLTAAADRNQSDEEEAGGEEETPEGDGMEKEVPETQNDGDLPAKDKLAEQIKSKMQLIPTELPPVSLPCAELALDTRKALIEYGGRLEDFYSVGAMESENELAFHFQCTSPTPRELEKRLSSLGTSMTEKKVEELLQELPSKRLLLRFIRRFEGRPLAELERELVTHFGLLRREVPIIAKAFRAFVQQDYEFGVIRARAMEMLKNMEDDVAPLADLEMNQAMEEINKREKALERSKQTRRENEARQRAKESNNFQDDNDEDYDDDDDKEAEKEQEKDEHEGIEADDNRKELNLTEPVATKNSGRQQKRKRDKSSHEEDGEEANEPSAEDLVRAETQARKARVDALRASILKSMEELRAAELELERSERLEQGFQKKRNEEAPFRTHPTTTSQEGKQKNAENNSSDELNTLKRQLTKAGNLKRSVSIANVLAGPYKVGENTDPTYDDKGEPERKALEERKKGWFQVRDGVKIRSLGIGARPTTDAGLWYRELELANVKQVSGRQRWNWMERYKVIMALPESSSSEAANKYGKLLALYDDFLQLAISIGKTILLERFLPDARKSILPHRVRTADVGRGDQRVYFLAGNIHFKFASDDDGLCNGSEEHAAKYHGHSIRNSVAFLKCGNTRITTPFEALIEYNGSRLHAIAHLPVEHVTFDAKGKVKRLEVELVLGSEDKGKTVMNSDKGLDRLLGITCSTLNLAMHGVKGERDLLAKFLYTPGDLRGFKDYYSSTFYLHNFRRLFPPEDPEETPHLPRAPRGQSIFWRQLRPEFVKKYPKALSADALSMFSWDTPDWQQHALEVKQATRSLVKTTVQTYAEELARRPIEEVFKSRLSEEMHARGINLRHLGLLRSMFWRQLRGTVRVTFSERVLVCSHDVTKELMRGQKIRLRRDVFKVSTNPTDPFDAESKTICIAREPRPMDQSAAAEPGVSTFLDNVELNEHVPLYSSHDEIMFTGVVSSDKNSDKVRSLILAEIIGRTIKHMAKAFLRQLCEEMQHPSDICTERVLVLYLNLISGAEPGSNQFWALEVIPQVEARFGTCALGELEKLNLRKEVEDAGVLPLVVDRFLMSFDAKLTPRCQERFDKICGSVRGCPCCFLFTSADLEQIGCRVKHNLHLHEFCKGLLLSTKAREIHTSTYESVMMQDKPLAYWPLTERPGTKVAINRGSLGLRLSGKIQECKPGQPGFVKNQWPDRAMGFPTYKEDYAEQLEGESPEALDSTFRKPKLHSNIRVVGKDKSDREVKDEFEESSEEEQEVDGDEHEEEEEGDGASVASDEEQHRSKDEEQRERSTLKEKTKKKKNSRLKENILHLASARIDTPFHEKVVPQERIKAFSVECWARASTNDGKERYLARCGRFALITNKMRSFAFRLYDTKYAVMVELSGPPNFIDKHWHYIVGTFDGTVARLYIDAVLVDQQDYDEAARFMSKGYAKRQVQLEVKRRKMELEERQNAAAAAREESKTFFKSKQGQIYLSSEVKKLVSRSESKIKLNQEKAKILGLKPLSATEARAQAMNDWVKSRTCDHLEKITDKHRSIVNKRKELWERRLTIAKQKATLPLRIGAGFASTGGPKGCFSGEVQHLAVFDKEIPRDSVNAKFLMAQRDLKSDAERLFNESAMYFETSLVRCYDDNLVLDHYSTTMGHRAAVDSDSANDTSRYTEKIEKNLQTFENKGNATGIVSLLFSMPDNVVFATLVCNCWKAIQRVDELFFTRGSFNVRRRRMQLLEQVPDRFDLAGIASRQRPFLRETAAEMYRYILKHSEDHFGPDVGYVAWIAKLVSPRLVTYLVGLVKAVLNKKSKQDQFRKFMEEKARMNKVLEDEEEQLLRMDNSEMEKECLRCLVSLDIAREALDIDSHDLGVIAENVRTLENINLSGCLRLNETALLALVQQCKYLESIELRGTAGVNDDLMVSISENCLGLKRLDVSECSHVSDAGVSAVARNCGNLRHLFLSKCELVSDLGIVESAPHLRRLETLDVSWCLLLTNSGLFQFASNGPKNTLRTLSIAGCRRIGDDGILGMSRHFGGLTSLDVSFCNKITDLGGVAITHSFIQIQFLNMSDLYQVTDKSFFYDSVGDGRVMAEQSMLSCVQELNLSDCKNLSDHAIAEIGRRAPGLKSLILTGCVQLTDQASQVLTKCPITGILRGDKLVRLDLSYCQQLTGQTLSILGERCPMLQSVDLSGCTQVTDKNIRMLSMACSALQELRLAHCKHLSDKSIEAMTTYLWVEQLDISYCNKLTDKSLAMLAEHFPGLSWLGISWCRKFTDEGILLLAEACSLLQFVNASGCDKISSSAFSALLNNNPNCKLETEKS